MYLLKSVLTIIFSFAILNSIAQDAPKDCSIFKSGKFRYLDSNDPTGYIVINGTSQIEYSERNDYTIESEITWTSDCSYTMKMLKNSVPGFPFKPGDIMKVEITKIKGKIIYYTATVNGQSWTARFKKIGD